MDIETEHAKVIVDVLSVGTICATFMEALPHVAALFSVIWGAIRIYETHTVQRLLKRKTTINGGRMSNFDRAFDALMAVEKGFTVDAGGATMWGVTEAVARKHGWKGEMKELPLEFARSIAKGDYWDAFGCEQFDYRIGFQVFDAAYNGGKPGHWLQRAVGVTEDGRIGAVTVAAVRKSDVAVTVARFNAYRLQYLTERLNWADAGKGWARRIVVNLLKGVE